MKKIWVEVENQYGCLGVDTVYVYFDFANCFGIGEDNIETSVMVWPNPTSGTFTLSLDGFRNEAEIEISTLEGKMVFKEFIKTGADGSFQKTLDLSGEPDGIYLLRVIGRDEVRVSRIIRN